MYVCPPVFLRTSTVSPFYDYLQRLNIRVCAELKCVKLKLHFSQCKWAQLGHKSKGEPRTHFPSSCGLMGKEEVKSQGCIIFPLCQMDAHLQNDAVLRTDIRTFQQMQTRLVCIFSFPHIKLEEHLSDGQAMGVWV